MFEDRDTSQQVTVRAALDEGQHLDIFIRAVTNILNTDIAHQTFAQLVDGLPLDTVLADVGGPELPSDHPVWDHSSLCAGVLKQLHEVKQSLDLSTLSFESELLHSFRSASPGSRQFNVRLAELAARAIHDISVQLHQLDISFHKGDEILKWTPEPSEGECWPKDMWPRPTLFCHYWYDNHEEYPQAVADIVAYWAEAQIFGGVVLFDRRVPDSAPDVQSDSIWLHADRSAAPTRICKLNDDQRLALIRFLTSEHPDDKLLPILPGEDNPTREDSEEPVRLTGIYRDPWERKPWDEDMGDDRWRDVWDSFEYPSVEDWNRARERAAKRRAGLPPYGEHD